MSGLGPQFHQLAMFMTPKEVGDLHSGDWPGRKVRSIGDRLGVERLTGHVEDAGGIHTPIQVSHVGYGEERLDNGHHRSTVAIRTNRLVPVVHTGEAKSGGYGSSATYGLGDYQ